MNPQLVPASPVAPALSRQPHPQRATRTDRARAAASWVLAHSAVVRFGAALALATTTTVALSLLDVARMSRLFGQGSYYLMLASVGLWAHSLALAARRLDVLAWLRRHRGGLLAAGTLTLVLFLSIKPALRVLSDEANLIGVSKAMAAEHSAYHHFVGKWYYGIYHPQIDGVEKRPLLFSFLLHLVHATTGYRVENAYALNALTCFALLLLVYLGARKRCGVTASIAAAVFVAAQPIFGICATSAGFDLLAALTVAAAFAALQSYLNEPSADRLFLVCTSCLMLFHARYESALFALFIAGYLFATRSIRWRHVTPYALLYALTPILLLPRIWQHVINRNEYENPPGVALFSATHFAKNLGELASHQLDVGARLPYALPMFWLAAVAGVHLLARYLRTGRTVRLRSAALVAAVALTIYYVVLLSHFMGKFTHPSQARFFLVLATVTSVVSSLYLTNVLRLSPRMVLGAAVVMFLIHHPIAAEGSFMNAQVLPRRVQTVLEFLRNHVDHHALIVTNQPAPFAIYDYGTTTFDRARRQERELRRDLQRHLYSEIVVLQQIRYRDEQPEIDCTLSPLFKLEPLLSFQDDAEHFTRVSRLTPPADGAPDWQPTGKP